MKKYITIGELAEKSSLSRSTLLYYEREGLLRSSSRSMSNYRLYDQGDILKLEQIRLYRGIGLPVKKIFHMLETPSSKKSHESITILQKHLQHISSQIDQLRKQQADIIRLTEQMQIKTAKRKRGSARALSSGRRDVSHFKLENEMLKKERWIEIMSAAGFSSDDMQNWHRQFEKLEPEAHQEFLESLGIDPSEIAEIRKRSES